MKRALGAEKVAEGLVSRAYFHVFFGAQLEISCGWEDVVCTTAIHKFFASAVDRLCFPAGEAMTTLLRLSVVRRLEFFAYCVKPPLARSMFEAIEKMPTLESLDVEFNCAPHRHEWLEGAFPTFPLSLARFKGRWDDVQHLVGREHQCEEVVMSLFGGSSVLYSLNARKIVIEDGNIEQFAEYEGPLPLECTEILEVPFKVQPRIWHENQDWPKVHLPQVMDGITRLTGPRKTPFLLLTTKFEAYGFVV
ncbi:hypothetical protein M3Y99_00423700 [Aphelenchoides fujianensis]|nr:hypothetical protein M3Y99_00423700 [Aphelenchoides fujianensis]